MIYIQAPWRALSPCYSSLDSTILPGDWRSMAGDIVRNASVKLDRVYQMFRLLTVDFFFGQIIVSV